MMLMVLETGRSSARTAPPGAYFLTWTSATHCYW
jgi:hypothetical protein